MSRQASSNVCWVDPVMCISLPYPCEGEGKVLLYGPTADPLEWVFVPRVARDSSALHRAPYTNLGGK
jgi:hypothetical protein